jgi:hypothetical protein
MTDNIAVGIYPTAGKLATPDDVVTGVEREINLEAVTL